MTAEQESYSSARLDRRGDGERKGRSSRTPDSTGRRRHDKRRAPTRGTLKSKSSAYLVSHLQALLHSLGRMAQKPVSSVMTVAVIGIALALPAGLHVILQNLQGVSAGWENTAQMSLFLKQDVSSQVVDQLITKLEGLPEVAAVAHITPQEALEEFRNRSGFGAALDTLQENPLPTVLVIQPKLEFNDPQLLQNLRQRVQVLPAVDLAQLDMEWIRRLFAIMEIGKRGVQILGVLLSLAVLLIVGNTIRLAIQNRREEIEVQKLIGATDGFIRRPFLYNGFWHGLLGAVSAWLLVNLSMVLLNGPVSRLSLLYDSARTLHGLDLVASLVLLAAGILLGLLGAWVAVGRNLREIEPS